MKVTARQRIRGHKRGIPGVHDGFWIYDPYVDLIGKQCQKPMLTKVVYYMLCKIAAEEQKREFRKTLGYIGSYCCVGNGRVKTGLAELVRVGLITAEINPRRPNVCPVKIALLGEVRL